MFSSVLASFAPLLLLASSATAAIDSSGVSDLRPIVTGQVTLFVDSKMNFTGTTTIYDPSGKAAYTVEPSSGFLTLKNVKYPSEVQQIKSGSPSNCVDKLKGSYYINGKGQWTLEDATNMPGKLDTVYVRSPAGAPAGVIQLGPDADGRQALAQITGPVSPESLPKGSYYSISIPANEGHAPYVTRTDAIILVVTILQAQSQCSSHINK